ncbi:hypothetical protein MBLNU13_g04276t1 [Cladosporium sp. NU13]
MAELAAMGVASCILQVVDFGARVAKTTYQLVSASYDALREDNQLATLVSEQDGIAERLQASLESKPVLSANEQAVVKLSAEVKNETNDLLDLLRQFKDVSTNQNFIKRSVHSAKTAIKIHRKKEEIERRRSKLQLVNGQLATALASVQRDQEEEQSTNVRSLQQSLDTNTKDVLTIVLGIRDDLKKHFKNHEEKRQACIWNIISSIGFPDMQSRQYSIPEAYSDTYRWALTQDSHGLTTWLRTGSGIYWVSGKAGSGKSTFMKFLANHPMTHNLLAEWSGSGERLVVINCYFWYLGSPLQKSFEGLLRTILYQILSSFPSVTEILFPARRTHAKDGAIQLQAHWTFDEVQTALRSVVNFVSQSVSGSRPRKFCMFIDGLDEYIGDHRGLIELLRSFVKDGNCKLCVSSRPWNVFVNEFENKVPHLFLHELTKGDIRHYVESKLKSSISATSAYGDSLDGHIVSITDEVATRAEGVFLWVYLVVKSIISGLDEGDKPEILRKRVLEYPVDLENFFDTILCRIDPFYHHQTAQSLVLAFMYAEGHAAAAACSSFLDFEFIGRSSEGLNNTQFLWVLKPKKLRASEFLELAKSTRKFLSAACKDLLVLPIPGVFDYLKSSGRIQKYERKVPHCFKDGSVFHLVNMGKLKSAWDLQPVALSPYFVRQVAFSLNHYWPGLNVDFIDQMRKCQPLHQDDLCASIAAAYVAFERFHTFQRDFTTLGPQQRFIRTDPSRSVHGFTNQVRMLAQKASTLRPLFAASLGVSDCRTYPPDNIDVMVLISVLRTIPKTDGKDVISRFLGFNLPPILEQCETASSDPVSWNEFFASRTMQSMYDVVQILRCSGHSGTKILFSKECPIPGNNFREAVWNFLTTRSEFWEKHCAALAPDDTPTGEQMGIATALRTTDDGAEALPVRSTARTDLDSLGPVLIREDELELQRFVVHMRKLQEDPR